MEYASSNHKVLFYKQQSRKCNSTISKKLVFNGNFTPNVKSFDIKTPIMRRDLFGSGVKKEAVPSFEEFHGQVFTDPTYEDPRDIIVMGDQPVKPPRRRPVQTSPRSGKDGRTLLKEQKRKLTKKYEGLIMTLMDRCEENVVAISEKDTQISKLRDKLKAVLDYNRLFADENDALRAHNDSLLARVQQCDAKIEGLETRGRELEERVRHEAPDRDTNLSTAIPLVEVCISCSSRQIFLQQVREQNSRLHDDMQALKDVLYRLNIQLARCQEKLRSSTQNVLNENKEHLIRKPSGDAYDSLITASLVYKQDGVGDVEDNRSRSGRATPTERPAKVVELSGLLSAQALAPLFDAYQENIQEKENLIHDYEKQFEKINIKTKNLVSENKTHQDRLATLEADILTLSKKEKKLLLEKETSEMERAALAERAEKAEGKLKEVYELYENKISAMMRDYETVHREYYATKTALAACEGRMSRLQAAAGAGAGAGAAGARGGTVPADLHERRVESCQRLLDELKHQYSMEGARRTEMVAKLQEQKTCLEAQKTGLQEKNGELLKETAVLKEKLRKAEKNVKLYRKAAEVFRHRWQRACRRRRRRPDPPRPGPDLTRIREEIKLVKARAYKSLEELEQRMIYQERRAARAEEEYRHDLERARLALEHKEDVIRSLIDKVADVEEVRVKKEYRHDLERARLALEHKEDVIRSLIDKVADVEEIKLSQSNTHRLQGIVLESSERSEEESQEERREERRPKLVPTGGGFYQDSRRQRKRDS